MTLKISISGIRGIAFDSLTDDVIFNFSKVFALYSKGGKILVASDGRSSGKIIREIVIRALCSQGAEVIDIGICPTPTAQLAVKKTGAKGAIIITASHNPPEWNGLKFVRSDGIFLNEAQAKELIDLYSSLSHRTKQEKITALNFSCRNDVLDLHISDVLANVNTERIKKMKFKVAVDCCNGAGSVITPKLLKSFGCEVIAINTVPGTPPPRGLEPIQENLGALCEIVKKFGADIGFAQDPDADRLAVVDEKGVAIGEEYSMVLAALFVLENLDKNIRKNVATNLSTSRMIDDLASKYKAKVYRTKIGEVNVSEKMVETGAVIGGEGNGGVIYPKIGYGRDSLAGIGLILDLLSFSGKKISEIVSSIPYYVIIKEKIALSDRESIKALLQKTQEHFRDEKLNVSDGIKVDYPDSWVHVRSSNTEPVVRLIAEAPTKEKAKILLDKIKAL